MKTIFLTKLTAFTAFFALLCLTTCEAVITVTIIDENNNESITKAIPSAKAPIGVFGATPSYKHYGDFYETVKKQYGFLYAIDKNGDKAMVDKAIRKLQPTKAVRKIFRHHLTNDFKTALMDFDFDDIPSEALKKYAIALFFATAINKTVLKKNITELCKKASENGKFLVHLFLPSYFQGVGNESVEDIQRFLTCSATYYQRLYKEIAKELPQFDLSITILIPKIASLMNAKIVKKDFALQASEIQTQELVVANVQTILAALVSKIGTTGSYAFINHNQEQNEKIIKVFSTHNITPLSVHFETQGGKIYKDFTPYNNGGSTKRHLVNQFFINKKVHTFLGAVLKQNEKE